MPSLESRMKLGRPSNPKGAFWPQGWTVKTKLVVTACIPLLVLIPVVGLLMWSAGQAAYSKILISKVRSDLELAQQVFRQVQLERYQSLKAWAESANLLSVLQNDKGAMPEEVLKAQALHLKLDFLRFIRVDGRVNASWPVVPPYQLTDSAYTQLSERPEGPSVVILGPQKLAAISPALPEQVTLPIIPTKNATPDNRKVESKAMVLEVFNPVYLKGALLGYLEGGIILNRNTSLVDGLNDLIYPQGALLEGSIGTATIFLDDVRIATTVRSDAKDRALGTRVSDEVRQRVLGRGENWLERAYVVNNWYMAGYAPILNPQGSRIGMLYVGFLEGPYSDLKSHVLYLFLAAILISMFLGAMLVERLANGIFYPLKRMNYIMSCQENGDFKARVGDLHREDEFADLAAHFDTLLDQLEVRRSQLESLNQDLDRRVSERTSALHLANQRLHQAVEQLLASEKLAVMGQLTAGIAHEFNNPLAVMMGHLDLLRLKIDNAQNLEELRLIDEQIQRLKNIVQKLLQFCRPDEFASYTAKLDIHEVIRDSLLFAKSDLERAKAVVRTEFNATRNVQISRTELQQIMVNLLINASHALEKTCSGVLSMGAEVTIRTFDVQLMDDEKGVCIEVHNNGERIPPEQLNLIFKMFYTTKQVGKGTGLGLPVSRMLIQRFGGDLRVISPTLGLNSDEPHGVCFSVIIRCTARPSSEILKESGQQAVDLQKQLLEGNSGA